VSLNGVALVSGTDYTATPSTNTISSLAALTASDVVEIVVYDTFSVFGGSVNGDFTISNGTLAAEAVTVTGLTTTGNINFGDNDKAIFGAGSDLQIYHSGNDSYVLDSGTGDLYLAGENNVRITSNTGLEAMATLTANGAVTLFHDNAAKLATTSTGIDVTGTVTADGLTVETASGGATAEIVSGGGTSSLFMGDPSDRDSGSITYANASDSMQFVTNASERLRITSAGSVGISTTSPTKKISASIGLNDTDGLALEYNGENRGGILLNPIGGEVRMGAQNSTGTYFTTLYSNGSERVRVDQSGNVGIGTTSITTGTLGSSNRFLEVSAGTANGSGTLVLSRNTSANNLEIGGVRFVNQNNSTDGSNNNSGKLVAAISGRSVTTDSNAGDDSGGVLVFNTKPETGTLAERMRIDSSGNLLVGGTNSTPHNLTSGGGFSVRGSLNLLSVARQDNEAMILNRTGTDGEIVDFRKDGTTVGNIGTESNGDFVINGAGNHAGIRFVSDSLTPRYAGNDFDNGIDLGKSDARFDDIFATNGTIQTSDQQEKNTITDSDLGLDFINRLEPKSYVFNGKTRTHYGLIAQDVETVLGDISKPTSGFAGFIKSDISEEEDGSEYRYGLRYTEFVGPLIQAVKDLKAENDAMRARLTALENAE
jgi:hypothetical protein